MKKLKKIPDFKSEKEEREFWESHDTSEYLDLSKAERAVLPNLKPSTKTISLRLPEGLLNSIKVEANKRDMPYQSLIKVWLAKEIQESRHS
ncbi:MAG: BrnA antitoxin family protein [Chromatiaceae bacterium]|nr:BrnA antitoxin family protein [Chromatiaceae bacterium]MCP5444854.1 BrnA antitoxin family protein [Chromatiaceae bacterium]